MYESHRVQHRTLKRVTGKIRMPQPYHLMTRRRILAVSQVFANGRDQINGISKVCGRLLLRYDPIRL